MRTEIEAEDETSFQEGSIVVTGGGCYSDDDGEESDNVLLKRLFRMSAATSPISTLFGGRVMMQTTQARNQREGLAQNFHLS